MTEHNIFQEIDDDMERQRLEALWKRYGALVMVVALIAIVATGAFTTWQAYRESHNQAATASLVELANPTDTDTKRQIDALKAFANKNSGTSQAVFAELHAAAIASTASDKEKAVQIYDGIAVDAKADMVFRQYADLQAVRLQMDKGNPTELMARLQPLTPENAPWRFSAMEYQGYLAIKIGDKAKARVLFAELAQDAAVPHGLALRAADMMHYVSE